MFGLSPEDDFSLCDAPVLTQTALVVSTPTTVAPQDPTRCLLIFCNVTSGSVWLAPSGMVGNTKGMLLPTANQPPLILSTYDYGSIVGVGWDAFATSPAVTLNVITVALRRSPEIYGYAGVFIRPKAITPARITPPRPRYNPRRPAGKIPPAVLAQLGRLCPRILGGE